MVNCSIENCNNTIKAAGYCTAHLQRYYKYGNPLGIGSGRHGKQKQRRSSEYTTWINMRARCRRPNHMLYEHYGGRGITVCDRWLNSYSNFLEDIGSKPDPTYSLDRIDNDGDYEPSNCRWTTWKNQANNRRISSAVRTTESVTFSVDLEVSHFIKQKSLELGITRSEFVNNFFLEIVKELEYYPIIKQRNTVCRYR